MNRQKRTLKVLHLASFAGNIGDLANHAGAYHMLAERLDFALEFTELEIREFYWKKRAFDDDFVLYANSFDLLLIGGGNYFELWVEKSATGTSIDIAPERLAALTVPTIFFALGVDTGQGYSQESVRHFAAFMRTVLDRRDIFVCVRNDGSAKALREVLPAADAAQVPVMPDGGFFASRGSIGAPVRLLGETRVGINIAGDMLERRFDRCGSPGGFLSELAGACSAILDSDVGLRIELVPHIWRDVSLIAELLPLLPDPYLRRRVTIGRLETGATGLADFLMRYRAFDLVLGMRFHANVCPIGMQIPTRGLLSYPQVELLYQELGLPDRLVDVRQAGFGPALVQHTLADLTDLPAIRTDYARQIEGLEWQAEATLSALNEWMHRNLD